MSRKSLPRRLATAGIMMPRRVALASLLWLEPRFDQLAGDDRGNGEVPGGVEFGQPRAQPGVIPQTQDEVAAGLGLEPEVGRLEAELRLVAEPDREAVGHANLRPRVGFGKRDRLHHVPKRPHLMPA